MVIAGNVDPMVLYCGEEVIRKSVTDCISQAKGKHVLNLGHGNSQISLLHLHFPLQVLTYRSREGYIGICGGNICPSGPINKNLVFKEVFNEVVKKTKAKRFIQFRS